MDFHSNTKANVSLQKASECIDYFIPECTRRRAVLGINSITAKLNAIRASQPKVASRNACSLIVAIDCFDRAVTANSSTEAD